MSKIKIESFLEQIHIKLKDAMDFHDQITGIENDILSKRPASNKWSVYECIQHINLATELYLDQIEAIMSKNGKDKHPVVMTGLFANYFVQTMEPKKSRIRFKMKTFKKFVPIIESGPEVLPRYLNNLKRIQTILDNHEFYKLNGDKVITALGPILKFKIGEALQFVVAHNSRHIQQAKNVLDVVKKK